MGTMDLPVRLGLQQRDWGLELTSRFASYIKLLPPLGLPLVKAADD